MPEPSGDSLVSRKGPQYGNGQNAEPARKNMELRGPARSTLDQINDKLGGFDPPSVEFVDLPFGESAPPDTTSETKGGSKGK